MNEPATSPGDAPGVDEQLVAYLDGELDAEASRRVEEALSRDPAVRKQLRELERSWDLMDRLPRAEVDESFVRSTVEMIALKAEEDLAEVQAKLPSRQRRAALVGLAAIVAAGLAGFALSKAFWQKPNEQLLVDLPVVEQLDEYRQAGDIEFLRMLDERNLFPKEGSRAP